MESTLDPIFQAAVDSKRIPGVAAVALDVSGKVLFSKGYGNTTAGDTSSPKVTPETPALIWSCTKLVTSVAMLQLVEQGKVDIDAPAEQYVPEIAKIQKLNGFGSDGQPILSAPKSKITVLQLITHTAGFSYDFFNKDTMQYRIAKEQPPVSYVTRSEMEEYTSPLIAEPGEKYEYGVNIDWLGFIVEKVSGLKLDEYITKYIAEPLGLKSTGPLSDEGNFFKVHAKDPEGNLTATEMRFSPPGPIKAPGGHFMYSSCADYAQFLLALLNNGTHPTSGAKILEAKTAKELLFTDMMPKVGANGDGLGVIPTEVPAVSCTGQMLPGVKLGWSCGLLMNLEPMPNGRSKGSGAWAGLGNCYYWIDPAGGKLGFIVSAVLPFFDKDVLHLFDALERAVYDKPMAKEVGEKGSNFEGGNYKVD